MLRSQFILNTCGNGVSQPSVFGAFDPIWGDAASPVTYDDAEREGGNLRDVSHVTLESNVVIMHPLLFLYLNH